MLKKGLFLIGILLTASFMALSQKGGFKGGTVSSSERNETSSVSSLSLFPQLKLNAQITSISLRDSETIQVDDDENIQVVVKNTGEAIWQRGTVFLDINIERAPSGSKDSVLLIPHIPPINKDVSPKESYKFTYEITGPRTVGEYIIRWRMRHNKEGEFGSFSTRKIRVSNR